jgi:predicted cupin superfamily sugar epimerase
LVPEDRASATVLASDAKTDDCGVRIGPESQRNGGWLQIRLESRAAPPDTIQRVNADEVIAILGLQQHPEGGWYRETWRSDAAPGERAAGSAIYFLLRVGDLDAWHRVDAAEAWHWYAGAPLEVAMVEEGSDERTLTVGLLGSDLAAGQRPQIVVPAGAWQQSRTLGEWTLAGCTVSPAFEFRYFELAPVGWEPPPD